MTYIICLALRYKIESSNIIDLITILSLQPKVGFRNISAFIPAKWWYIFCILNSISICRITLVRTRNILWLFIIIYWAKVSGDLLRMTSYELPHAELREIHAGKQLTSLILGLKTLLNAINTKGSDNFIFSYFD